MRVLDIIEGTVVDGVGLRTSIYFAGCTHHCPGCHNPQSWDFLSGREMSVDEVLRIVEDNGFDVTFTGGDPLYQAADILPLAMELHRRGYAIWCYTGYRYESIAVDCNISPLLACCDVLVDGPFMVEKRDVHLLFRGSSNQRLIDLQRSTPADIHLWEPEPVVF